MPAEASRLRRRVPQRDWGILAILVSTLLVALAIAVVLTARGSPVRDGNCVTVNRASIMGAADYSYCGSDAVSACRRLAGQYDELARQCEELDRFRRP